MLRMRTTRSTGPALVLTIVVTFWAGLFGLAQAGEIAILLSSDLPQYRQAADSFRATSPRGSRFTEYQLNGSLSLGREAGRAVRASRTDVVFAVGLKAAVAAKLEILDTPVIYVFVLNPTEHGLPAPNMIGISTRIPPALQLGTWRKLHPSGKTIGLLYDPQQSSAFVASAQSAARDAGLTLVLSAVSRSDEVPPAYRALLQKIDALWLIRDPTLVTEEAVRFFVEEALRHHVPVFTYSPDIAHIGALASMSVSPADLGRQAAEIGRAILAGEPLTLGRTADPEDTLITLNLHTANYLGLSVSKEALRLATTLIGSSSGIAQEADIPSESPNP